MSEIDVKSIALFFFYALLDERRAIDAAAEAYENCRNRLAKNHQLKSSVALVASTKYVWQKNSERFVRGRPNYSSESGWLLPESIEMGPWKEFQKSAQEDEFLCLIWSQILQLSDEDISLGLGISPGTLRYRTGRALRKLGSMTNAVTTKTQLGIVRE